MITSPGKDDWKGDDHSPQDPQLQLPLVATRLITRANSQHAPGSQKEIVLAPKELQDFANILASAWGICMEVDSESDRTSKMKYNI